jgi:SAM-dependent methyltransferase
MRSILRARDGQRQPDARPRSKASAYRGKVLAVAFAALYGPAARTYDRFTGWLFLGEWQLWQDVALDLLPADATILEIGSGTGALAVRGAATGRRWYCIERSGSMIAVSQTRCRRAGVALLRGDARALPLLDSAFDAVVATFPTSFVLAGDTAAELARVVRPDGTLVVVLSGELRPSGLARRWRRNLLRGLYGPANPADGAGSGFAVAGFKGETKRVATPHGEVLVYAGSRYFDSPGRCDAEP